MYRSGRHFFYKALKNKVDKVIAELLKMSASFFITDAVDQMLVPKILFSGKKYRVAKTEVSEKEELK